MCVKRIRKENTLTHERLKTLLHYCPDTGFFTWLDSDDVQKKVRGKRAGTTMRGYVQISVDGVFYQAQRLAWFYQTGIIPTLLIDHKDGIRRNNWWLNLREADDNQNQQNRVRPNKNNSTGYLGVSRLKNGMFLASLTHEKRTVRISTHDCPAAAHQAYLDRKRELHEGCTI